MAEKYPLSVHAKDVAARQKPSNYPAPFAAMVEGREKRALGDIFGLTNFGVNLTRLPPGSQSALLHRHSLQDELIYVIEGNPTLVTEEGETLLAPGMCAGFKAGGIAHHLVNKSDHDATILEIGDRTEGDEGSYPRDDLMAQLGPDGKWRFTRKDGKPY